LDTSDRTIAPEKINSLVYVLVSNKYATLRELRDEYNIKEALDLYEICMVSSYNRAISMEDSK
jgi:hypothetical protein